MGQIQQRFPVCSILAWKKFHGDNLKYFISNPWTRIRGTDPGKPLGKLLETRRDRANIIETGHIGC